MIAFKRAMLAFSSFLNKSAGAFLGFFLYPLVHLLRILKTACLYVISLPLFILLFSVMAAVFLNSAFSIGLIGAVVAGLIVASALIGLTMFIAPVFLIVSAVRSLINSPIEGVRVGWNEGISSVLVKGFRLWLYGPSSEQAAAHFAVPLNIVGLEGVNYRGILNRFGILGVNAPDRSLVMTQVKFNELSLSLNEIERLVADRLERLTPRELQRLEAQVLAAGSLTELNRRFNQGEVLTKEEMISFNRAQDLLAYKNLQRLDSRDEVCSITQERPAAREDILLLVKQYQKEGQWLPVPGVSHLFDKQALKRWFVGDEGLAGHVTHPLNRESIINPASYRFHGHDHGTRYVYHPLYVEEVGAMGVGVDDAVEPQCLSQEFNVLTGRLRDCLVAERPLLDVFSDDRQMALSLVF